MAISVAKSSQVSLTKAEFRAAIDQYLKTNNVTPALGFSIELLLDTATLASASGSTPTLKINWNPDS